MSDKSLQRCINPDCAASYAIDEVIFSCPKCGSLLDIEYDWEHLAMPKSLDFFEHRWSTKGLRAEGRLDFSGVWRFRELLPFARPESIVTIGEGRTLLFLVNHTEEPQTIPVPKGKKELLTGAQTADTLTLDRYGVGVVKLQ